MGGGVHYHAFLPPRTLLPLNDPRTFQPSDHSLHVIALPVDAETASSAQPSEPEQPAPAHARNQAAEAAEAADASIRIARRHGDNNGAEAAVVSITDEAQDAMHAGNSKAADVGGAQEDSWQASSGSVPVRRSRRLRSSVHASGLPESIDQSSLHAHSYSRLSSSLGSEQSLPQSLRGSGLPPSSVSNLPRWTLPPPSKLTPLCDLLVPFERTSRSSRYAAPRKRVSLICCVITVTPPIPRQRRFQSRTPRYAEDQLWVASWKVLAPLQNASDPASCTVTLYESCARDWGGAVRRGDVVLLQDAEFQPATPTSDPPREAQLVLSPKNGAAPPQPTVLFRTLPRRDAVANDYVYRPGARGTEPQQEMLTEDRTLRPDLGVLARSDIGVRRVAEMAQWCAEWVGGEGPST